ncbi:MAG TPA: TetR/AcrR family transcriptional regulator [Nitrospiria bacterium]|nr:TetR/AcrR family transcriptional regulator [Nitrospiria bacterium]
MARPAIDRKDLILKAAIKVFARRGFSRARTAAIAREARVAEGTIYNYFKSKDDLILTIFERTCRELIQSLRAALNPIQDPVQKLALVLVKVLDLFEADPMLAEVFLVELRQSGKCFSTQPMSVILEFLDLLESILKEGIARGVIRKDINTKIARSFLFGAVENIVLGWLLRKTHPDLFKKEKSYTLEEAKETLIKLFGAGFVVKQA